MFSLVGAGQTSIFRGAEERMSTMSAMSTELIPSSINIIKIHSYYLFADQGWLSFLCLPSLL